MKKSKMSLKICSLLIVTIMIINSMLPIISYAESETYIEGDFEYNSDGSEIIKYLGNQNNVIIPEGATKIKCDAFKNCTSLEYITLPNTIIEIENSAFEGCINLENIMIPNSVTQIGARAFYGCESLTDITLSDNMSEIKEWTFANCKSLNNITLPNGITKLGDWAFRECTGFTNIVFPESVKEIGTETFWGCSNFTKIIIPDNVTKIGYAAFDKCSGLTDITLSNNITKIEPCTFWKCTKLNNVIIPEKVTEIGWGAFYYCYSLTDIMLPNSLIKIEGGEFGAFELCTSLESITIPSSVMTMADNTFKSTALKTIYGYKGDYAETYANENGIEFVALDDDVEETSYTRYYDSNDSYCINIRDKSGMSVYDCKITFGDNTISTTKDNTYITIPKDYDGNIIVSKEGYITSVLPVKQLKKYNFFKMYEKTEPNPVIQHFLIRTGSTWGSSGDLLRNEEYISDLGVAKYDIYIDVNNNGVNISEIYLEQGDKKLTLRNGLNGNVAIGQFKSKDGTIKLCIKTSDGRIYRQNSRIVAKEQSVPIKFDEDEMSTIISDSIEGIGGKSIKCKWNLGIIPISITIKSDGTFKGTIGIQTKEPNKKNELFEDVKNTIKQQNNDKTNEISPDVKKLYKKIENFGGEILNTDVDGGFGVKGKCLGYIEGKYNLTTGEVDESSLDIGVLTTIEGNYTWKQQRISKIGIPYWWKLKFALEFQNKLNSRSWTWKNGQIQADIKMPEASIEFSVTGDLELGIYKIVGIGPRFKAAIKGKFVEPEYNFKTSIWTITTDTYLMGNFLNSEYQMVNFADIIEEEHLFEKQIYPQEKTKSQTAQENLRNTYNLMSDVTQNSKNIAESHSIEEAEYNLNNNQYNGIFKSNGYTFSKPTVARLSDGTIVMAWIDYDNNRSNANKTALYYSVLRANSNIWSEPKQVEDDGTADDLPVLKTINDKIYLVWNDCSDILTDDATVADILSKTDISFAEFDGTEFINITNICDENNCMDVAADFTVIDNKPVVIWIRNDKNDIFCQTGKNSIMISKYDGENWSTSVLKDNTNAINSVAICNENNSYAVYMSLDTDGDIFTNEDYEIFKVVGESTVQVTYNNVADTSLISTSKSVFWKQDDKITNGENTIDTNGMNGIFTAVEDGNNNTAIIYCNEDNKNVSTYYACVGQVDGTFCLPVEIVSGEYISGGHTAFYNGENLILVSNEINESDYSSKIYLHNINNNSNIGINYAYYDDYTLIKNNTLKVYTNVENKGLEEIETYTINIYGNNAKLYTITKNDVLRQGENRDEELLVNLPENIDFNSLRIEIVKEGDFSATDYYELKIATQDISIENIAFMNVDGKDSITAFAVNRGITDIPKVIVNLRKDSEDGEILDSIEINNLVSYEEKNVQFELSEVYDIGTVFYITVDELEDEAQIANNSSFTVKNEIAEIEMTVEKSEYLIGDINGDSKVNTADFGLLNAHLRKKKILEGEELARADINGDGKVNTADFGLLNSHLRKKKLLW